MGKAGVVVAGLKAGSERKVRVSAGQVADGRRRLIEEEKGCAAEAEMEAGGWSAGL
ncbi:hypothetical protein OIU77_001070 [Salix suchowensis]|uniref:Uncharacterized protein n=1 Tax=Salix suchowensis TaxID=1278906 RepID=A0ABQ9BAC1_9ROSI|nr:hypothetical protein OIU77_001070 [Salix suchowensis]